MSQLLDILLVPWVYGPLVSLAMVLALLLVKQRVFALVGRMAARTATRMDDLILSAANQPLNLLIVASGLLLLGRILPLTEEADRSVDMLYRFIVVGAGVWNVDRLMRGLLDLYAARVPIIGQGRAMIQGVLRGLFLGLGVLILLDSMGISITPLIASLGVGSLAVALALQGTLANLFAGIHLLADRAIEPGQFIRLESGQEGYVERIGWRSTRVRMPSNVTLIVPNAKLVDSVITNYDLPDAEVAVVVPLGVHYDSDLGRVEQVTIDVARQVMHDVDGAAPRFDPIIRYTAFADSSITFNLVLRARSQSDQPLLRHEVVKRIHERYRSEGIVIPYPMRTLDIPDRVLGRIGAGA